MGDTPRIEPPFSDEELTALALAADPFAEPHRDAEPFALGEAGAGLLPDWYMPAALGASGVGRARRRRSWAAVGIIASLLIVNAYGLCVTYGQPEIAW